jgi:hypothetical protein
MAWERHGEMAAGEIRRARRGVNFVGLRPTEKREVGRRVGREGAFDLFSGLCYDFFSQKKWMRQGGRREARDERQALRESAIDHEGTAP